MFSALLSFNPPFAALGNQQGCKGACPSKDAMTIQTVLQELRSQGNGLHRIQHVVFDDVMERLAGISAPNKKNLAPPQIPAEIPGPLPPSPPGRPPPLPGIFNKNRPPPPSLSPWTPPSPLPQAEKIKNIWNVHQGKIGGNWCSFSASWRGHESGADRNWQEIWRHVHINWKLLGWARWHCAKPLPEDLGDEILHFYPHPPAWRARWIFGGKFSFMLSQGKWLKICHSQNFRKFTTFSTARKEIYHLELALGATSRKGDIRRIVEELARRIDAMQNGTHPRGVFSDSDPTSDTTYWMSVSPCNWRSKIWRGKLHVWVNSQPNTPSKLMVLFHSQGELILQKVRSWGGVIASQNLKIILTTPTPHICKKYAPKICHTMGVRMA